MRAESRLWLAETNFSQAQQALLKLKNSFSSRPIALGGDSPAVNVGISFGIAQYEDAFQIPEEMFRLADGRLYEEKNSKKQAADAQPARP